ncbi:rRNA biogenesis protein RRP36, putative [Plasmodium vinckei brucechwatti]|uniref:rRNA biogenesis protein RRP36 n=1 Tax=Plasmodium vinckei brucechwatti TaxID=119398 RepID=A0A6V7RVC5_PLAVN|nr:rRNA biogenesis protein RRP36, putative [Plasmodium vinckei brucechwatti]
MEEEPQKKNKKQKIKKSQKPMTVSNRKPFNVFDKNNKTAKPLVRDPRFSNLSGSFNPNFFRNAYKFLYDTREHEKEAIETKLKSKNLDPEEKNKLKNAYSNYKNTDAILKKKEEERKLKSQLVKQEKENILNKNKTPYYYSDRKIKKMIQEKGENKIGMKKIIKKEKKVLQKERRNNMIPERRYVDQS